MTETGYCTMCGRYVVAGRCYNCKRTFCWRCAQWAEYDFARECVRCREEKIDPEEYDDYDEY